MPKHHHQTKADQIYFKEHQAEIMRRKKINKETVGSVRSKIIEDAQNKTNINGYIRVYNSE